MRTFRHKLLGTLGIAVTIAVASIGYTVQAAPVTDPVPVAEAEKFVDDTTTGYLIQEAQGIFPAPDQKAYYSVVNIVSPINGASTFTEATQKNAGRQKLTFNLEPLIDASAYQEALRDDAYLRRNLETFVYQLTIPEAETNVARFAIQRSTEALQDVEFRERSGVIDPRPDAAYAAIIGATTTSTKAAHAVRFDTVTAFGVKYQSHGAKLAPDRTFNTDDAVHVRPIPVAEIFGKTGFGERQ